MGDKCDDLTAGKTSGPHFQFFLGPFFFFFLIEFIGVTPIDKAIQVSSVQLNETSSAHCTVGLSLPAKSLSIFIPPLLLTSTHPPPRLSLCLSPHCCLSLCFFPLIHLPSSSSPPSFLLSDSCQCVPCIGSPFPVLTILESFGICWPWFISSSSLKYCRPRRVGVRVTGGGACEVIVTALHSGSINATSFSSWFFTSSYR